MNWSQIGKNILTLLGKNCLAIIKERENKTKLNSFFLPIARELTAALGRDSDSHWENRVGRRDSTMHAAVLPSFQSNHIQLLGNLNMHT